MRQVEGMPGWGRRAAEDAIAGVLGATAVPAGRRQVRTPTQPLESPVFKVTLTPLPDLTGCPEIA